MKTDKRLTREEIKEWFKKNKPEVIKEKEALQNKDKEEEGSYPSKQSELST